MNIDLLEAIWVISNLIAIVVTFMSLLEARQGLRAARENTSPVTPARVLTASGNVRREAFRIVVSMLLLSLALPGLFSDHQTSISVFLVVLMAIPLVTLVSTLLDRRERWQLDDLLRRAAEEDRSLGALESSVQKGIDLTRTGNEAAQAAYQEANAVNVKIAGLKEDIARMASETKGQPMVDLGSDGEPLPTDN